MGVAAADDRNVGSELDMELTGKVSGASSWTARQQRVAGHKYHLRPTLSRCLPDIGSDCPVRITLVDADPAIDKSGLTIALGL
jgi:hypothetical protein